MNILFLIKMQELIMHRDHGSCISIRKTLQLNLILALLMQLCNDLYILNYGIDL